MKKSQNYQSNNYCKRKTYLIISYKAQNRNESINYRLKVYFAQIVLQDILYLLQPSSDTKTLM